MQKVLQRFQYFDQANWQSLFLITLGSVNLYVFLEWLFIITKPSFLSRTPFIEQIEIFFFASAILSSLSLSIIALLGVLSLLPGIRNINRSLLAFGSLLPAGIITTLVLLLIDNFTYTLFNYGIIFTEGWIRAFYGLGFAVLFIFYLFKIPAWLSAISLRIQTWQFRSYLIPVLLLLVAVTLGYFTNSGSRLDLTNRLDVQVGNSQYPNILLITADGLDVTHTSLDGYPDDNTPRINQLSKTSLVAENMFNNSASTGGSVISMYTSKPPTETRMLYAPDILQNEDSYQHLPGILAENGYYNAQFTDPHYADAVARNVLSGFHYANGQDVRQNGLVEQFQKYFRTNQAYFLYEIGNRVADRLRHIFFFKKMDNQIDLINGTAQIFNDREKVNKTLKILQQTEQPVFVHLHWLGTHGPKYRPKVQVFSEGKDYETQDDWDPDLYSDSILEFDIAVGEIMDFLSENGLVEKTIVLISSDHGQHWSTLKRIPMIIRFPSGQYARKVTSNVQLLDIAPTLIDYLDIDQPEWMEGESFLQKDPDNRIIFGFGIDSTNVLLESKIVVPESVYPPFYQFGFVSIIYCNQWYRFNLASYKWETGIVEGSSTVCDRNPGITDEKVFDWMVNHLTQTGFDTSDMTDFSIVSK